MQTELRPGHHYRPSDVLRQAGAMLLLDEISAYGHDWVEARVQVRDDTLFMEEAGLPSWVGIEFMAQTASAYSGILQRQAGEDATIALLLGTRRYRARVTHFARGALLHVRATQGMIEDGGLAAFDCAIRDDRDTLAEAAIKAYRPHDLDRFLDENG